MITFWYLSGNQLHKLSKNLFIHFLRLKTLNKGRFDLSLSSIFCNFKFSILGESVSRKTEIRMISRLLDGKCPLLLPDTHSLFILGSIISTIAANKRTSITRCKYSNANKVDILKLITKIAKKNISKLIPLTVKRISHTSLTITKERVGSNISSSHKRFILPTTLNFTMILRHCCLTISQDYTLNFLE